MDELKGIEYLKYKLSCKRPRVLMRYRYYDMKYTVRDMNITTPKNFSWMMPKLGWCKQAVDSFADRCRFDEFRNDNFKLNEIFQMNNPDILFNAAITGAAIASCSFIYIHADENGFPQMEVIDASDATGIIDNVTGLLKEGYAVLARDDKKTPIIEAYFEPGATTFYEQGREPYTLTNTAPYPLLVPIINRPDAKRKFGHSVISRSCMSLVGSACRTIMRSEVSAEFYSFPQKYVTGLSADAEGMDTWKATISSLLQFSKDEDGDSPTLGQFSQQSMTPYNDQLKMIASVFAGETGLTTDDLGFATDNPSSAEAIKAAHETLRLSVKKAQQTFGYGFLNAGYLAACVRDNYPLERKVFYQTTPAWKPIFEPDVSALAGIGDCVSKFATAVPGYLDKDAVKDLTGIPYASSSSESVIEPVEESTDGGNS